MDTPKRGPFDLSGKDIWVFGGAGYLGQPVVRLLHELGATVLCVDLGERSKTFIDEASLSPNVTAATLDVSDCEALDTFVQSQIQERNVPHGLVNLTFASTAKRMEDLSVAEFDQVNHTGLTSTFVLTRAVGEQMAQQKRGSIVSFSSMYGVVSPNPEVYQSPMNKNPLEYGVGKAGIIQMTKYMAVHWGKRNVRCNCISPGPFPNPTVQQTYPDFVERLAEKSPMGRVGKADEIAGSVAFLLSDAATYITGHNLMVDGGWTSW
ncbi:SDR family oxidoreductase [Spirosoma sp. BT702]|uniref:SDR family oxidoreductase n=1 Tax=Spirosoma profusum TaxID=2771354 RepID=A0A926Y2Y9_9BACT|nr:SDR family oxidoreductase [Spirosoma profusum]MBD2703517.1 SDR family oxidoreductase [Spirosoma profusum]